MKSRNSRKKIKIKILKKDDPPPDDGAPRRDRLLVPLGQDRRQRPPASRRAQPDRGAVRGERREGRGAGRRRRRRRKWRRSRLRNEKKVGKEKGLGLLVALSRIRSPSRASSSTLLLRLLLLPVSRLCNPPPENKKKKKRGRERKQYCTTESRKLDFLFAEDARERVAAGFTKKKRRRESVSPSSAFTPLQLSAFPAGPRPQEQRCSVTRSRARPRASRQAGTAWES